MNKIAVDKTTLKVGELLLWSIYDDAGRLLLSKGETISSERQLATLLSRNLLRFEDDPAETAARDDDTASTTGPTKEDDRFRSDNPFVAGEGLWHNLAQWDHAIIRGEKSDALVQRMVDLAQAVIRLCAISSDGVLGAMQTQYYGAHAERGWYERRQIHLAVLCELVAKRMGMEQSARVSTIAAALTCNLGMSEFAEQLQRQDSPLTADQRAMVNAHPSSGFDMLTAAGVTDETWLRAVIQHHERPDGTGYPLGLSGDLITEGARLLSLSEMFVAMVSPRSYRKRVNSRDALRELYMERGKQVDEKLAAFFVKELGVFPPGSCVRLANGETAVVVVRTQDAKVPQVKTLTDASGQVLSIPVVRDTKNSDYAIKDLVDVASLPAIKWPVLWGFK